MRASTLLIAVLTGATIVSTTIAWQQYERAEQLAAAQAQARLAPSPEEPAPEEPAVVEPMAEAATEPQWEEEPAADGGDPSTPAASPERVRSRPAARFNELMEDPAFAAAWQTQQKARLDERYAALFRRLNLSPAEIDRLKTLLADRQVARMDVMAAARSEGLSGRENQAELRQLMQQANAEIDAGISELLGPGRYAEYQRYEQTAPQRNVVSQLETRLSYSAAPLTPAQSEALVNILTDTSGSGGRTAVANNVVVGTGTAAGRVTIGLPGNPAISDTALTRAQGLLSAVQLEALRQLQAEQQSQQQLQQMMRRGVQRDG